MKHILPSGAHPAVSLLNAGAKAVAHALRRHAERSAHRRLAWRTERALVRLDARTLRDLGLTRSQISSVASEIAAGTDADVTQRRIALPCR